jgi:hypothetical protein
MRPLVPHALALALCVAAFANVEPFTRGLDWPAMDDSYRELAGAQTMLDEGFGGDFAYRGEQIWYNPLTPSLVALEQRALGVPLPILVARMGPYVNLVTPIAFYVAITCLVDAWTALAALAAFLFITPNVFRPWEAAGYSAWLLPTNLGQGFLYAAWPLVLRAHTAARPFLWPALAGAALGLVFLTHTAPALILGAAVVMLALLRGARTGEWRRAATGLAVTLGVALLVSAPLVLSIVGHYGLRTRNLFPAVSVDELLDLSNRKALLRKLILATPFVPAALALAHHLRRARTTPQGEVLLAWTAAILLFLGLSDLRLLAERAGLTIPTVVPSFHFFLHFMALVSVGFGLALRYVARWPESRSASAPGRKAVWSIPAPLAMCVLAATAVVWSLPAYFRRADVSLLSAWGAGYAASIPRGAYTWIRRETRPGDVFLTTDDLAIYLVGPAGRKVVATNKYYSHPYVDWERRDTDRDRLFELVRRADASGFDTLAAAYGVTYVLVALRNEPWLERMGGLRVGESLVVREAELAGHPSLTPAYRDPQVTIYRVLPRPHPP